MSQTILEKLQLKNEKNILIQGLPSSIEKQFSKLSFAKSQLNAILDDIMPALKEESKLWVAYPKLTSKITTDLNREGSWSKLVEAEYESAEQVSLDHVWHACYFKKSCLLSEVEIEEEPVAVKKKSKLASV